MGVVPVSESKPGLRVSVLGRDEDVADLLRRALASQGFEEAGSDAQGVVVASALPPPGRIADMQLGDWLECVEEPLAVTLDLLQGARSRLAGGRGSIVVVAPTIGIAGASQLVALTTVVEGVRAMAKSAARQWAGEGIRVNAVLVPLEVLRPSMAPLTAHLAPPQGEVPDAGSIGAAVGAVLCGPGSMVGATILLDGGSVMAP